jgi:Bardet-Biedl syndrome 1 protein
LPSVPVFIAAAGLFDVEYRIVVACRDGRIYVLKNGEMNREPIEIAVQPVGLVVTDRHVIVGGMNHTVYSYHVRVSFLLRFEHI